MINKDSSGELIAPRRRTELELPASDPPTDGGIPVISRLPILAGATTPVQHAQQPHQVDPATPGRDEGGIASEPWMPTDVESARVAPMQSEPAGVSGPRRIETQPPATKQDHVLTASTKYPWNQLLLGLGLAGLFWLAMSAVTRWQTTVVTPPTPPTVHYHITPPAQQDRTIAVESPSAVESGELASRFASRPDEPSNALNLFTDGNSQEAVEYPSTEFPELPLPPPPPKGDTAESGVRLSGNIQKFKN